MMGKIGEGDGHAWNVGEAGTSMGAGSSTIGWACSVQTMLMLNFTNACY